MRLLENVFMAIHGSSVVMLPHTITFQQGQLNTWYFTDSSGVVKKKKRENVTRANVLRTFFNNQINTESATLRPSPAVAVLYKRKSVLVDKKQVEEAEQKKIRGMPDEPVSKRVQLCTASEMTVQFLSRQELTQFLDGLHESFNRTTSGILQKFTPPNGSKNEVIRVDWSPHTNEVLTRTNIHLMDEERTSLYKRFLTYEEDDDAESLERSLWGKGGDNSLEQRKIFFEVTKTFIVTKDTHHRLLKKLSKAVNHLAEQFAKCPGPRGPVDRMVVYFKVGNDSNVYFHWAEKIEFQDQKTKDREIRNSVVKLLVGTKRTRFLFSNGGTSAPKGLFGGDGPPDPPWFKKGGISPEEHQKMVGDMIRNRQSDAAKADAAEAVAHIGSEPATPTTVLTPLGPTPTNSRPPSAHRVLATAITAAPVTVPTVTTTANSPKTKTKITKTKTKTRKKVVQPGAYLHTTKKTVEIPPLTARPRTTGSSSRRRRDKFNTSRRAAGTRSDLHPPSRTPSDHVSSPPSRAQSALEYGQGYNQYGPPSMDAAQYQEYAANYAMNAPANLPHYHYNTNDPSSWSFEGQPDEGNYAPQHPQGRWNPEYPELQPQAQLTQIQPAPPDDPYEQMKLRNAALFGFSADYPPPGRLLRPSRVQEVIRPPSPSAVKSTGRHSRRRRASVKARATAMQELDRLNDALVNSGRLDQARNSADRFHVLRFLSSPTCYLFTGTKQNIVLNDDHLDTFLEAGNGVSKTMKCLTALQAMGKQYASVDGLLRDFELFVMESERARSVTRLTQEAHERNASQADASTSSRLYNMQLA